MVSIAGSWSVFFIYEGRQQSLRDESGNNTFLHRITKECGCSFPRMPVASIFHFLA